MELGLEHQPAKGDRSPSAIEFQAHLAYLKTNNCC
jgi:hypothetical protein